MLRIYISLELLSAKMIGNHLHNTEGGGKREGEGEKGRLEGEEWRGEGKEEG